MSWLQTRNLEALSSWEKHQDAKFAAPSPDHLIPALIVAGASEPEDEFQIVTRGADGYSLTMTSFAFRTKGKNEEL